MKTSAYILVVLWLTACANNKPEAQGEWIKGSEEEQIKLLKSNFEVLTMQWLKKGFIIFQSACHSCHVAEKVIFIQQAIPHKRLSPAKFAEDKE